MDSASCMPDGLYGASFRVWCYRHPLPGGQILGDAPVDAVTREMLGAMIRRIRESGRSLAIIEGVRNRSAPTTPATSTRTATRRRRGLDIYLS
jgi:hypothetical protein